MRVLRAKAIAFIGQNEKGVRGVYAQDFAPCQDTTKTRRVLGGFEAESTAESFGISPDGTRIAIASREQLSSLMMAERLRAVSKPAPSGHQSCSFRRGFLWRDTRPEAQRPQRSLLGCYADSGR